MRYEEEQELIENASTVAGLAISLGSVAAIGIATGVGAAGLGAAIPLFVAGKIAAREIGKGIATKQWNAEQERLKREAEMLSPPEDEPIEPGIDWAMLRWDAELKERHGDDK
jgi:hypothetical protein